MIGVLPSVSPTDVQGVMGLIAFLADPKACSKRLKELDTLSKEIQDKSDALGMDKNSFEQLKVDIEAQKKYLDSQVAAIESTKRSLQESQDAHQTKVTDFNAQVSSKLEDINSKISELKTKEAELKKRENAAASLADQSKTTLETANKLKADFEARLSKLKDLTN